MPKYSVRKPFTVLVAVVLILITGIVSYTKMTPDLLPNIDMPYVVVLTPYPGATPEKVENTVTKPIEQNMATLTDIKNVQSVSNSNYSMIILEFEDSVNMDTVSSDILQKVNLASGSWDDDTVGTSTILKLNPSMLPVASIAADYKGMSRAELSEFVNDTLINELEGTAGVASISTSGVLEEKVNIVIRQDKIDEINNKILASVNSSLASAQRKIDSGKAEIQKNKAQVKDGLDQLKMAKDFMPKEEYKAQKKQLDEAYDQLKDAESQLRSSQAQLDSQARTARANAKVGDKITTEMISGILKGQNFSMPAGYVEEGGTSYLVSVGDDISTVKEAKNLYLFDTGVSSVGKLYVKDVADVFMADNAKDIYSKINGENGVVMLFSKQSNYATSDVCKSLEEEFDALSEKYDGLSFTTLMNQGDYIDLVVNSILQSLLWGALFAAIVLMLFLRNIRSIVITLCSIPISIVFAILLMYFSGITINLISMSGLAVAVGMLVDNSVVVIENTVRLRREGMSAPQAAAHGAKQVAGAITGSTLTTVCVFVPIIFTEGITRKLFTDMALTVSFTLVASLIIALTLVPAMSSRLLTNIGDESKSYLKFTSMYENAMGFVLKHKISVLLVAILLLVGSVYTGVNKGFIFMPEMSTPQLQATLEMPKDSTAKEIMEEADRIEKKIHKVKGVETVGVTMGDGSMQLMGSSDKNTVSFYIMLDEEVSRSSSKIAKEINKKCESKVGTFDAAGADMSSFSSAMGGSGISLSVYNSDIHKLRNAAKKIANKIEKVEGVGTVSNGIEESDVEYHFAVKKTDAMKKGLTVAQVYQAIVDAMAYEDNATSVTWEGSNYDVVVSSEAKEPLTPKEMKDLTISVEDQNGNTQNIKLSDIATLQETETLKAINRDNQKRYLTVTADLKEGYNVTKVTDAASKALEGYKLPAGTTYEFGGAMEQIMDSMKDLALMLVLAIVFVYLVMVAQFQSLKSPFIIMFTIPLAFTGGFLALILFNKELSVIAMIGMVMLTGIIVNNGIVLVDYINQLRMTGMEKKAAIIEAGKTRIRPIMMTSLTTILGLVVMAFGNSSGTDMVQPMALVCIGGLLYATLLTLFIVPIIYDLMNGEKFNYISEEDLDI